MAFGSGFSNFFGDVYEGMTTADDLKDYRHASKLFLSDGYALAPQTKFLFHVYFTLNTTEIPELRSAFGSIQDISTIGMMVKTADLPKFSMDVEEKNQYNRKRYVQNKINYNPVNITFHDDGSDLVRSMWNAYYTYYYSDSTKQYDGVNAARDLNSQTTPLDFNRRDIYDNLRDVNDWGYSGAGYGSGYKPNFFKDVKIYGLNRGNFTQYTLINPIITDWAHDTFDYRDGGGTMSNSVTLRYETVKYSRGKIEGGAVKGFGDPAVYDTQPSMFTKTGAGRSILGTGGLVDAGSSIIDDLASGNILGAFLTADTAYENFRDFDFRAAAKDEGTGLLEGTLSALATSPTVTNSVNTFLFPKPTTAQQNNTAIQNSPTSVIQAGQEYNLKASQPADVNSNGAPVNSQWRNPDE